MEGFGPALRDISYIAVLGPDGGTLASSDPAGAAFAPPERADWARLHRLAQAGERNPRELVIVRPGGQPAALGASAVFDQRGRPIATVVIGKSGSGLTRHPRGARRTVRQPRLGTAARIRWCGPAARL